MLSLVPIETRKLSQKRFRSRISFRNDLNSLNNFKRHVRRFLGVKEKARELGVTRFELKYCFVG